MQLITPVITGIVGLLGVLVGVIAQYVFTTRAETRRHYQDLRTRAYLDFVKSAAGIGVAQRSQNAQMELEFTALYADAKFRLGIYGSKDVVVEIADFHRKYGTLNSKPALTAFLHVVATMRAETPGGEKIISDPDLGQLLFGEDVQ